jgi:hypothetical protein
MSATVNYRTAVGLLSIDPGSTSLLSVDRPGGYLVTACYDSCVMQAATLLTFLAISKVWEQFHSNRQ